MARGPGSTQPLLAIWGCMSAVSETAILQREVRELFWVLSGPLLGVRSASSSADGSCRGSFRNSMHAGNARRCISRYFEVQCTILPWPRAFSIGP